mmetsp:Transcript_28912/g.46802  ORF Transcript_28912/g.46802 Transcript_28912/m.46802 type:complete len:1017 (-) Transcript_28912:212-3262(-)
MANKLRKSRHLARSIVFLVFSGLVFVCIGFSSGANVLLLHTESFIPRNLMESSALFHDSKRGPIIKSIQDHREYRYLDLENQLKVLLISDETTEKASAALDVAVGHISDPQDLPGLAHFLEHMLFLGTEKYPEEGSYREFLSQNGGSSNAFTSTENTNYFFGVTSPHLEQALDRFAQFFVGPLLTESATEREMKAVDSEHKKNLQSDAWRCMQLLKSSANPEHPFNKFGTGNLETLSDIPKKKGIDVRAALLKFHQTYYSANNMRLVVLGQESLDQLEGWVREKFAGIKNHGIQKQKYSGVVAYGPKELKKVYEIVPVKNLRSVALMWPIPYQLPFYKSKPCRYISHLIGHEGPGSILSLLKAKGWADGLEAGESPSGSFDFSVFAVNVVLTAEGENYVNEVIGIIFQYIKLLREKGAEKWVYEESRVISEMQFRFKDKEEPTSFASAIASNMHEYPIEHVLAGPHLFWEFEPKIVEEHLALLTPENLRVHVMSKKFDGKTELTEKIYATQYNMKDISEDLLEAWADPKDMDPALQFPHVNPFIPTNFEILSLPEGAAKHPQLVRDDALTKAWHKQDDAFFLPKCNLYFDFITPVAYQSPLNTVYSRIFTKLIEDALAEFSYFAEIAGLSYNLYNLAVGFRLSVRGYSDKILVLIERIVERIAAYDVTQHVERFELMKDAVKREYKNYMFEAPYQSAMYSTNVLIEASRWHILDYLAVIDDSSPEGLSSFKTHLLKQLFLECLIHGNIDKQGALAAVDTILQTMSPRALLPSQFPHQRIVQLSSGVEAVYLMDVMNPVDNNSAIETYFQIGPERTQVDVLLDLLGQILSKPAFHQLRTVEQLGYTVFSGVRRDLGIQGLRVIIQSSEKGPSYLNERILLFLNDFMKTLEEMSSEEFGKYVSSLIANKQEKDKTLAQESARWWVEISSRSYQFDRVDREVEELRKVEVDQLRKAFRENVSPTGSERRMLSVQFCSRFHSTSDGEHRENQKGNGQSKTLHIKDAAAFRRSMPLYPSFV